MKGARGLNLTIPDLRCLGWKARTIFMKGTWSLNLTIPDLRYLRWRGMTVGAWNLNLTIPILHYSGCRRWRWRGGTILVWGTWSLNLTVPDLCDFRGRWRGRRKAPIWTRFPITRLIFRFAGVDPRTFITEFLQEKLQSLNWRTTNVWTWLPVA